jgi:hypothetical protein
MPMLYMIGVAHLAQSLRPGDPKTEAQQYFTCRLDQLILDVKPAFVAEEDSKEALDGGIRCQSPGRCKNR